MAESIINKLFVAVPAGVAASEILAASAGSKKLYFLEGTGELIVKGKSYGASADQITELHNATEAIAKLNGDANTEGSVAYQVAKAVAGIVANAPEAFDTLKEIANWIANEDTEDAATVAGIISSINTLNGDATVAGSVDYKIKAAVDGINGTIDALDYTDEAVAGEYVSAVGQADGKIAVTRTALPSVEDVAVAGQYVSAVSEDHGKITVSRAALPQLSVAADSADFAGVADHEISIKTAAITGTATSADADGKVTPAAYAAGAGLIKASDVAAKLNEEATALGTIIDALDGRVDALETADYTRVNPKTEGHVQVAVTDDKVVTITENDIASKDAFEEYVSTNDAALEAAKGRITTNEQQLAKLDGAVTVEGSIKKQINDAVLALDAEKEGTSTSTHVTVKVVEVDGKIDSVLVSDNDIASAAKLATAESNITNNANAITKEVEDRKAADEALESKLVAGASEGYQTMAALETKIKANAQAVVDEAAARGTAISGLKSELIGDAAEDYNTLGKLEDKIQAVSDAAKSYKIVSVPSNELGTNVKEAFKLVDEDNVQAGAQINIYKDSSLKSAELVKEDKDGNVGQYLKFVYILANGTDETVYVNISEFLVESEFKNGLQVSDAGEVSVKIDGASETFLTVSTDGVKLAGVQTAIDNAVADEAAIAREAEGKNKTAIENEVARAEAKEGELQTAIDNEVTARTDADKAINDKIGTVEDGKTVVGLIEEAKNAAIAAGTVVELAEGTDKITLSHVTAADGHVTYTIGQSDIASAQGLADLKAAVGVKGDTAGVSTVYGTIASTQDEVDALETYVGTFTHDTAKTVVAYVDAKVAAAEAAASNAIADLDATVSTPSSNSLITATIEQVDGKIASISLDETKVASKAELATTIDGLDANVTSTSGERVSINVVETDGKITAVTVTENDIAQASVLTALDTYVKQTQKEYIDTKDAAMLAEAKKYVDEYDFWEKYGATE